ncbi:hypothetical protein TrispH2_012135, partial [Trichoplax sp. H2]
MRTGFLITAIVVMTIAIPGNLLILWIILANRNLWIPINLLVWRYCPVTVSVCKISKIVPGACITSISFTLTAICNDRYNSNLHPIRRELRINRAQAYVFSPLCWLFAFSFWTPY